MGYKNKTVLQSSPMSYAESGHAVGDGVRVEEEPMALAFEANEDAATQALIDRVESWLELQQQQKQPENEVRSIVNKGSYMAQYSEVHQDLFAKTGRTAVEVATEAATAAAVEVAVTITGALQGAESAPAPAPALVARELLAASASVLSSAAATTTALPPVPVSEDLSGPQFPMSAHSTISSASDEFSSVISTDSIAQEADIGPRPVAIQPSIEAVEHAR